MAAVSLNDLVFAVASLASSVQQLGENYYRASDAINQINSNVGNIERRCQNWQDRARKFGLSSDQPLREALDEAQKELQKEKEKLERLQRRWIHRCFFKVHGTVFPIQLGQSLQRLLDLDDRILGEWRADAISEAEAQNRAEELARSSTFHFRRDDRYVRLTDIEREIRNALEDPDEASRVILLHGPPGTGKSCMARQLALDYKQASTTTLSAAKNSTFTVMDCCPPFEKVLYFECGEQVDFRTKQGEMLDSLGYKGGGLEPEVGVRESESEVNFSRLLKQFLKEKRILMILDDVWQMAFLERIEALCGQHVRILVTSQRSRLCDNSCLENHVKYISMDRITKEAAGDILKVHAGFHMEDQIARPIQACMDTLVNKVSTNPHALAAVATAIDHQRPHQLVEWQNAIYEYDNLLAVDSTLSFHGIPYPSSFNKSIQIKFQRLQEQERRLVILLAMLQGPSVPEPVVQLFFHEVVVQRSMVPRRSSMHFSNCRRRLEDLQCVSVEEVDSWNSWSIHFLDKEHARKAMESEMVSMCQMVKRLPSVIQGLGLEPQVHFLKILGMLYFNEEWGKLLADDLSFSFEKTRFGPVTKTAVQPIISLMTQIVDEDEDWSKENQSSADQVFISYMVDGVIHEEAARNLLSSPKSKGIFCDTVLNIVEISDLSLSEYTVTDMLKQFGNLNVLDENSKAIELNLGQCRFLAYLSVACYSSNRHLLRLSICKISKLMLGLAKILSSEGENPTLKLFVAVVVMGLALEDSPAYDEDRQTLLVDTPSLVEGLVRSLEDTRRASEDHVDKDTKGSTVQQRAAESLACLLRYASPWSLVAPKIANIGCQQLVNSLEQKSGQMLQEYAAYALLDIARSGRQASLKIFNCPAAITNLLGILELDSAECSYARLQNMQTAAIDTLKWMMRSILPFSESESHANSPSIHKISECLNKLLAKGANILPHLRRGTLTTLTWIDPVGSKSFLLQSAKEFRERGRGLVQRGYYKDGLSDLEKALQLDDKDAATLSILSFVMSKLDNWEAALKYADSAVEHSSFKDPEIIQDRGVLRRMMGDLPGALTDIDESLKIDPTDYFALKHRAYVKFLMGDETGSVADAEEALRYRPIRCDIFGFENFCLGTSIVEFMNFRL